MYTDDDVARLYTILNAWGPGDEFYLPQVMKAGRVLDVGCGSGALLHRARATGHTGRLVGIDPDRAALRLARTDASIEWQEGVAATMPWQQSFDLAVMTGHGFQCLITDEELHASLAAIHRALVPGGTFVFDTRNPARREWEDWPQGPPLAVTDHHGRPVEVSYAILAVEDDVVTLTETTATQDGEVLRVDEGKLRFLSAAVLNAALVEAGFTVEAQVGDWQGTPFAGDARELITTARAGEVDKYTTVHDGELRTQEQEGAQL